MDMTLSSVLPFAGTVSFSSAQSSCLQLFKEKLDDRINDIAETPLNNAEIVRLCKKIPTRNWEKIPELFNQQLASAMWATFDQASPLYVNRDFIHWFVKERVSHDVSVAGSLLNSLLEHWPDDSSNLEILLQELRAYLPDTFQFPDTTWFENTTAAVVRGETSLEAELSQVFLRTESSQAFERLLWKKLIQSAGSIAESNYEHRYYCLSAIFSHGFNSETPRWPELNLEVLEQLVPVIKAHEAYCEDFIQFAVVTFTQLGTTQKKLLSKRVIKNLEGWTNTAQVKGWPDFNYSTSNYDESDLTVLKSAADNLSAKACRLLGQYYWKTDPSNEGKNLATQYLTLAANGNDTAAQALISVLYHRGDITSMALPDLQRWEIEAFKQGNRSLFSKVETLASKGNSEAQLALGESYIEDNPDLAVELLNKAAQLKNSGAIFRLATLSASGDLAPLNREKAIQLYLELKECGHKDGSHHLATHYRLGAGVPKNLDTSVELYQQAASLNNMSSAYILGCLYSSGATGLVDTELAKHYFCQAAIFGNLSAQRRLKQLIENSHALSS